MRLYLASLGAGMLVGVIYGLIPALRRKLAMSCGCASACTIHGHDHARAWSSRLPVADLKSFWGALGCACWAV
jgi:hypothetical protein